MLIDLVDSSIGFVSSTTRSGPILLYMQLLIVATDSASASDCAIGSRVFESFANQITRFLLDR